MAPLLESEDEISEIEEVSETFLTKASSINSPLIVRKENTNISVSCENVNFAKESSLEQNECDMKQISKYDNCDIKRSDKLVENSAEENTSNTFTDGVMKNNAHEDSTSPSVLSVSINHDYKTEENQENIRPCKLKVKNKLNLKLNFPTKSEEKGETSSTNRFTATLNLPSPAKCLDAVEKNNAKSKRDNKVRGRISTKKGKVSLDAFNKRSIQGTSVKNVNAANGGGSSQSEKNGVKSQVISNVDCVVHPSCFPDCFSELKSVEMSSDNKLETLEPVNLCGRLMNELSDSGGNDVIIDRLISDCYPKISVASPGDKSYLRSDKMLPTVSTNESTIAEEGEMSKFMQNDFQIIHILNYIFNHFKVIRIVLLNLYRRR